MSSELRAAMKAAAAREEYYLAAELKRELTALTEAPRLAHEARVAQAQASGMRQAAVMCAPPPRVRAAKVRMDAARARAEGNQTREHEGTTSASASTARRETRPSSALARVLQSGILAGVPGVTWRRDPSVGFLSAFSGAPFFPDFVWEFESGDADHYRAEVGCDGGSCPFPNVLSFLQLPRIALALCLHYSSARKACDASPPHVRAPSLKAHYHLSATSDLAVFTIDGGHQHEVFNAAVLGAQLPLLRGIVSAGGSAAVIGGNFNHIQNLSLFQDRSLGVSLASVSRARARLKRGGIPNLVMAFALQRNTSCNKRHALTNRTLRGAALLPPDTKGRPECGDIASGAMNFPPHAVSLSGTPTPDWQHSQLLTRTVSVSAVLAAARDFCVEPRQSL